MDMRWITGWAVILFLSFAPNPLWARGGGGCFLSDSPILKANGTESPISAVQTGDELLAFTPEGRLVHAKVQEIIRQEVKAYVLLKTERGTLRVTTEHPFYVGYGRFKTLEVLKEGDTLFAWDGQWLTEQRIISLQKVHHRVQVYNLQTDHPNTFFAGRIAVHNKGGGCFPTGTPIRTPKGQIPIEKLSPGDTVLALDPEGKVVHTRIEEIFNTRSSVLVVDTDRGSLRTTADHPIGLPSGDFTQAGKLQLGQEVLLWKEGYLHTATVLRTSLDRMNQQVHNLRVGWPHTFLAANIVTHNKGGSSSRSSSSRSSSSFRSSSGSPSSSSEGGAVAAIMTIGFIILIVVILIYVAKKGNLQKFLTWKYCLMLFMRHIYFLLMRKTQGLPKYTLIVNGGEFQRMPSKFIEIYAPSV